MQKIKLMVMGLVCASALGGDLGFRWKDGQCQDSAGTPGLNPEFLGECGDLQYAKLENANLKNINFKGANFYRANLTNAHADGSDFSFVRFDSARLVHVDFSFANLTSATMVRADATEALFIEAKLDGLRASSANLSHIKVESTSAKEADFSYAKLVGSSFLGVEMSGAKLFESLVTDVVFRESTLTSADFHLSDLRQTTFHNCTLTKANFEDTVLDRASFLESESDSAKFSRAVFSKNTLLPFSEAVAKERSLWKYEYRNPRNQQPLVMPDGKTVVTGAGDTEHVVWLREGKQIYSFGAEKAYFGAAPALLADGKTVVAANARGGLFWLRNGKLVNHVPELPMSYTTVAPYVLPDGNTIIVSAEEQPNEFSGKKTVKWVSAEGKTVGEVETMQGVRSTAFPVDNEGTVLIGDYFGWIYWLKAGQLIARKRMPDFDTLAAVARVPVVTKSGKMLLHDGHGRASWFKDLEVLEKFSVGGQNGFNPLLLHDGETVVMGGENKLIWVQYSKGKLMELEFPGRTSMDPTLLPDGTIVVPVRNTLFWVKDGKIVSQAQVAKNIYTAPAVLGDGETVVLRTSDWNVHWLKAGTLLHSYSPN